MKLRLFPVFSTLAIVSGLAAAQLGDDYRVPRTEYDVGR